ncbi:hypothetical protein [Cellulomonas sp. NPDC058312]|uniref:hypothetical protein n=1 Tax=Cellulomonas sp. NPDC058312 TaxID=3346441 RepID=UPI0036F02166
MRPGPASVLTLIVLTALAGGVGVGVAVTAPGPPPMLASGAPVTEVPVTTRTFDDARGLALRVSAGEARALTSRSDGLVTATTCVAGGTVESGTSSFAVDGTGLLNLHTAEPLWRPLGPGDRGPDVTALHAALRALGHDAPQGDRVTRATLRAFAAATVAAGIPTPRAVPEVDPALLVWLPEPVVPVRRCRATAGTQVVDGDTLAELPAAVSGAALVGVPADAAPGDRVLVVDEQAVPVDPDGEVRDATSLAAVAASRSYRDAASGGDPTADVTLTVTWSLAEPLEVGVVPPSAVAGAGTPTSCVRDVAGRPVRVGLVGSELGQSYVVPAPGASLPDAVRTDPPAGCGG